MLIYRHRDKGLQISIYEANSVNSCDFWRMVWGGGEREHVLPTLIICYMYSNIHWWLRRESSTTGRNYQLAKNAPHESSETDTF